MSEGRSWGEDAVALGRDQIGAADPKVTSSRDPQHRRAAGPRAAGLLAGIGAVVLLVGLLGGGANNPKVEGTAATRSVAGERIETAPRPAGSARTARHRAGGLAVGRGRPASKPPQSESPRAEAAPEAFEPEAAPVYEPAPEPVAAPEPTPAPAPSPPPAPETPAAVEFGM